jgi:uncharacterized protein (TIGR02217 family)
MSNAIFPTLAGLGWSVLKFPKWSTKIQTAVSGKELRSAFYSYPIYDITLTYELLRSDSINLELQTILGFFNSRQGSFDNFLYSDPTDNAVINQIVGTGNATQMLWTLCRTYGGFTEPVMNVNTLAGVYLNGVLQTLGTQYTIDSTGDITFASAPGAGVVITWTGTYYYRCRFVKDTVELENFMYQLWALKKCELTGCLGTKI